LEVIGTSSWVVWIYEKLQLDLLRLFLVRAINLVHLFALETKNMGGGGWWFSRSEGGKAAENLEYLLSGFKFFNRSVVTVLYVEISIIQSCMSNMDVT
jgi:hypothetical protein